MYIYIYICIYIYIVLVCSSQAGVVFVFCIPLLLRLRIILRFFTASLFLGNIYTNVFWLMRLISRPVYRLKLIDHSRQMCFTRVFASTFQRNDLIGGRIRIGRRVNANQWLVQSVGFVCRSVGFCCLTRLFDSAWRILRTCLCFKMWFRLSDLGGRCPNTERIDLNHHQLKLTPRLWHHCVSPRSCCRSTRRETFNLRLYSVSTWLELLIWSHVALRRKQAGVGISPRAL